MRHHIGAVITVAVIVAAAMVSETPARGQAPQGGQAGQAGAGRQGGRGTAASEPLEDRRPPLFLRETFPMPKKEEIYISQANISDPNVELKLYGQTLAAVAGLEPCGSPQVGEARRPGNGVARVAEGRSDVRLLRAVQHAVRAGAAAQDQLRGPDRSGQDQMANEADRVSPAAADHQDRGWPVVIGDYMEGPSTDWLEREFSIIDVRWKEFDEQFVTTKGTGAYVATPDLSRIEEIGFASLAAGAVGNGGHGSSSAARLDWIEVYGRPVPR